MILYFSGTGNSRHAAQTIARIADDEIISINQRIKSGDNSPVASDKPFVFAGPVYAGRFPRIMDNYIRRVTFSGSHRAYFIATCAQTPWRTEDYVRRLCEEKSFSLLGFHSVIMPQGYVAGGGTQPKAVNDAILKQAEPQIIALAEAIRDLQLLEPERPGNGLMSRVLNPIMYACMIHSKAFTVSDRCTGCGKCEARCPLNNIKLVSGKPVWGDHCTHCMACLAGCPCCAIEYGKKTRGKPRYYLGDE